MKNLITAIAASIPLAAMSADLTIYTYDAFAAEWGPAPSIESAFEAHCECDIEFVGADSSLALLRKVQLEGPSSPADIILGLDTNSMEMARATNLFATPEWDSQNLNLPVSWTEQTFVPFDYSIFAFVYQKDRLATVPDSLEALRALPEDVKIVIQDPRSSPSAIRW